MVGLSSWLRVILLLSCLGRLIHASDSSPCSGMQDSQPIGINLSPDAVTAICVPSLDQAVVLASDDTRSIASPLPKYHRVITLLRSNYNTERHAKPQRHPGLWGKLLNCLRDALFDSENPAPPEMEEIEKPSSNEIRLGFLEAFEWVKKVSLADYGTNITSAVILFPRFFSHEVEMLLVEAAREAGMMPLHRTSPDWVLRKFENILEQNPTAIEVAVRPQRLLIIDYGLVYFDVRTYGRRCRLNYPIDAMGCLNIIYRLVTRLNSTNLDIQQQLDQGASSNTLAAAIYQSRLLMKMDIGVDLSDEEASKKEVPEKWPLDLDDWWTGQKKEAFIYWDDMRSVEAEYISELAENLDNLLNCLDEAKTRNRHESNHTYSTFDKVIILGNSCERPIIARAVRESIGEHARIIGGRRDADVLLEALAGARFAFKIHETEKLIQENQEDQQLGDHEEL